MKTAPDPISEIVRAISPVSDESLAVLAALIRYKTIAKDELFIRAGQPNDQEYFILSGVCRSYLLNPEGDEITISFYPEHSVLPPNLTRTKNNRSVLNFQAVTELEIGFFSAAELLERMIHNLEIREFANEVLKRELLQKVEKEIGLVSLTAKERLILFRKQFRNLENIVPHTQIASYLGITNISLSRIRGDLAKEH